MKAKTVAVIQARMGSSRLPGKMLLSLKGEPLIKWVVERVKLSALVDELIVAIPNSEKDDLLYAYLKTLSVSVFRGSEENVLDRFYAAALQANATTVVRVCADNPLIAPTEIDNLISFFTKHPCDYCYNHIPNKNKYPDGLGAEILSMELLSKIRREATSQRNLEHCLTYITDNPGDFKIETFDPADIRLHHPEIKLDVDTLEDLQLLEQKNLTIHSDSIHILNEFIN